jgi:hypothetical protein
MKIKEYIKKCGIVNTDKWWKKIFSQYSKCINEENVLTNFMVYMDLPFWKVEHLYDIAYLKFQIDKEGNCNGTTYEWMVETPYDEDFSRWLESSYAEEWFRENTK